MGNSFELEPVTAFSGSGNIRFVVAKDDVIIPLEDQPKLSSPAGDYGLVRIDTGEVLIPDGTSYTLIGDAMYSYTFETPEDNPIYRYYTEVEVNEIRYHVPATTELVKTSMLAIGDYTDSLKVSLMYGSENMHQWLCVPGNRTDEPVDYALRALQFIKDAHDQINVGLGRSYFDGNGIADDFADGVPPLITTLATMLSGILMYESLGVTAYDENNQAQHRLRWQRKKVEDTLKQLRNGVLKVTGGVVQNSYPVAFVSDGVQELVDSSNSTLFPFFGT